MIKLLKISKKNFWDVNDLYAGKIGSKHIATNTYTLLEAMYNNKLKYLRAIYNNNKLIGLVYFYPIRNVIWISRFMIDHKYQKKGYGSKSFKKLLQFIQKKYPNKSIELSTSNPLVIKKLQEKTNFELNNNKRGKKYYLNNKEYLLTLYP
tara:strand:- start:1290 stop:1739 length:450 start_codon:yes stop_codon:yes gene_type:complete